MLKGIQALSTPAPAQAAHGTLLSWFQQMTFLNTYQITVSFLSDIRTLLL
jgi:hypothetical protein